MNARKLTALFCAMMMFVVLLAGCSGGTTQTTTTAAATTTAATTTAAATTAAGTTAAGTTAAADTTAAASGTSYGDVADADRLDYINYDSAVPIVKDGQEVTLKFGVWLESGFPNNVTENWFWKFTEDQLNIIPDVEQILDTEKLNLLFASNQIPDIMMDVSLSTSQIVSYGYLEKQLLSYTSYLDGYLPSLKAYYDSDAECRPNYVASAEGDMYSFPRVLTDETVVGSYIRQAWLDQLGLEQPKTVEEFTNTMIAFRDAGPETLGVEKVIPIGGGYNSEWACPMGVLQEAFGYLMRPYWKGWKAAAGYYPCLHIADDGTEDYGMPVNDDIFYDFMVISNNWYNENLYSPDYFTMDPSQHRAETAAGYYGWQNTSEALSDSPGGLASWRMLAPLTSEFNSTPRSANYPIYGDSGFFIGGTTQYPEVCCRFIDLFFNVDWDFIMKNGPIEGITPSYGYKTWVWGMNPDNPAQTEEGAYFEGEESSNNYRNTYLLPTYLDQGLLNADYNARFQSAVKGSYVAPMTLDEKLAKWQTQYDEDPVKYADNIFHITQYAARGAYSGNGMYEPLRFVYRTPDVNETIADLDAVLSPYIQEQVALFISGRRSLSEFASFQEELRAMGIDEYDAILASEYAAFKAAKD
ncbi:MAG: hypothetical protein MR832_02320 [Clostridiales bacterium]|nr:hypothetical protein [Clostridiales bacterium]